MAALVAVIAALAVVVFNLSGGGLRVGLTQSSATTSPGTTSAPTTTTTTTPTVTRPKPAPPANAGTYKVASYSLTLQEPSSQTDATGQTSSGQWIRTLPTTVLYPKSKTGGPRVQGSPAPDYTDGPFPLVVFSQGFNMSTSAYLQLMKGWASAGYVVAAPTYPKTDPALGKVDESDMLNHPTDLKYVIATLSSSSRQKGNLLHKLVKRSRVAIIGHSDGGDVSLAVAANSMYRDSAVKAAVILSGAEWAPFGGSYYTSGSVPLLVAQGDADTINVLSCSAQLYDQAPPPKYYLDIPKAGHQQPYMDPGPWRTGVVRTVVAFLNAYLRKTHSSLNAMIGKTLSGGETLTDAQTVAGEPNVGCPYAPGSAPPPSTTSTTSTPATTSTT